MVSLGLSNRIDQVVIGFEGFEISHYLNTIETFAKSLQLWNWDDFLFIANDRFVNLELYVLFWSWNLYF